MVQRAAWPLSGVFTVSGFLSRHSIGRITKPLNVTSSTSHYLYELFSFKMLEILLTIVTLQVVTVRGGGSLLLLLGGGDTPGVSLINLVCDKSCNVDIPDVPQPYGSPGRRGSYAVSFNDSVVVCGGLDFSGPPISSFKDCQRLDLATLSWSEVPASMANYSALGASAKISEREFLVFGGIYTRNYGGPTQWVEDDTIQKLTLTDQLGLHWTEMEGKTYRHAPMLDSCAVSLDTGRVLLISQNEIVQFSLESQQWSSLDLDIDVDHDYSLGPYSCAKVSIENQTYVVVMDFDSPFAFNPESKSIIMLPKPRGEREKPIVTVIDTKIIVHGESEESFEESLGNLRTSIESVKTTQ